MVTQILHSVWLLTCSAGVLQMAKTYNGVSNLGGLIYTRITSLLYRRFAGIFGFPNENL